MKKIFYLLFIQFVFASCVAQSQDNHMLVTPEVFAKGLTSQKVQLIDVRTPKEFKSGHIANATNIHLYDKDFGERLGTLNKKRPVYVYCKVGGRSAEAVEIMKDKGFETIVELDGGIDAWVEKGKPVKQ